MIALVATWRPTGDALLSASKGAGVEGDKLRAIIVDDEEDMRKILGRMLPAVGIEVAAVLSTGEDAVAWMAENNAQIVVMDIQMPGIGGTEATRQIKQAKPEVTIFGFTGWGTGDIDAMLAAGATAVFEKTKLPELMAAIEATL